MIKCLSEIEITPLSIVLNNRRLELKYDNLNTIYRELIGDYPKFFKMDPLCKLGFIAADLLLKELPIDIKENMSVIIFNRAGSLHADRRYLATIADEENFYPSPALFVYTLANIVTGEIAIRHKIYGETVSYILDCRDDELIDEIVEESLIMSDSEYAIVGWVEYESATDYVANLKIIESEK